MFDTLVRQSYPGLKVLERQDLAFEDGLCSAVERGFVRLVEEGILLRNVMLQADSANVTLSNTKRVLLGAVGVTHKYLGIRMFAVPWSDSQWIAFKDLNDNLYPEANATLINLFTSTEAQGPVRRWDTSEPDAERPQYMLHWHKDKDLENDSAIVTYTYLPAESKSGEWKLGLRKPYAFTIPAAFVPLRSHSAYFLPSGFNNTFQHTIVYAQTSESSWNAIPLERFSSTHRRVQEDQNLWANLESRVADLLARMDIVEIAKKNDLEGLQRMASLHDEIEFEWLRQFWFKGAHHAEKQSWWRAKITELEGYWARLEAAVLSLVQELESAKTPHKSILTNAIAALDFREEQRLLWQDRCSAIVFQSFPEIHRPVFWPLAITPASRSSLRLQSLF
eukprot:TRINITY_DN11510_c0_g1_i1.p1 TRINITY_DN11510_c0_g1~~TRINITY_DN11510_c0_g1_i1.p1  ORF type:complete len:392 (-),score=56.14 TRINITY_DN11510_c0_g1_i1:306-1481(-)